jgi:hypothetical protein
MTTQELLRSLNLPPRGRYCIERRIRLGQLKKPRKTGAGDFVWGPEDRRRAALVLASYRPRPNDEV